MSETQQNDPDDTDLEGQLISVLDDDVEPGNGVVHSTSVWLTRCETDRPLYSLFVDGEIETTFDATSLHATHQIVELFELAEQGNIGDLDNTPASGRGWH